MDARTDAAEVAAAWEASARAVLEVVRDADDATLARPTDCPGWDVHDHLAHLVGVESWLLGRPEPDHELPDLPHVRHDFGRLMEVAVDLRRGVPAADLVAELAEVVDARRAQLDDQLAAGVERIDFGPFGEMTLERGLGIRTFDTYTHEQDVRAALARPGNLDSPAARVSFRDVTAGLPRQLSRSGAVPPGRSVRVVVTGPLEADLVVQVTAGDDGRPRGRVAPEVVPDATLTLGSEAFLRRSAGRTGTDAAGVGVEGDADLAARVLAVLAVTP